jgi:uncharacterized protein
MLVFDLRDLASGAVTVDDVLPASDAVWQAADRLPVTDVRVTGRLSSAGPGRFYFSGSVTGTARDECRRCLQEVEMGVSEHVQLVFAEAGQDDADEADVFEFDPRSHELDLRPAVREQWLLIAPTFVQCREDCAGLCPTCGADLNAGPCGCAEPVDERWAALRQGGSRGGASGAEPGPS